MSRSAGWAAPREISATRGDIRIAEAVRGTVVLRTEAGDISVVAAAGVSDALAADTGYGRVNALKNDGTADLDIRATTSHGDINARSI
ncbi:Putative adhesin domain-containing protein OS=Streptomyces alboniger OX=132473 GN=CP975_17530 PE=4 SV=1 [Streptomyces alboniger]